MWQLLKIEAVKYSPKELHLRSFKLNGVILNSNGCVEADLNPLLVCGQYYLYNQKSASSIDKMVTVE